MSLPHLTQPWSIPVIAMRFVSERKAERTTQSAWWKRSERQRKESCCFVVSPSASLFASTSAPNFARQAAEMTRGFEYERSMSSHIS